MATMCFSETSGCELHRDTSGSGPVGSLLALAIIFPFITPFYRTAQIFTLKMEAETCRRLDRVTFRTQSPRVHFRYGNE
jgi:hypothetical protein